MLDDVIMVLVLYCASNKKEKHIDSNFLVLQLTIDPDNPDVARSASQVSEFH